MKKSLFLAAIAAVLVVGCTKYREVGPKYVTPVPKGGVITHHSLVINECILKGTIANPPAAWQGSASKWVELYNPTDSDIVLTPGKWFFTDDLTNPTKFPVPQNDSVAEWKVPSKGFFVFMCQKTGSGGTTWVPYYINASFSLNSQSGSIGVFYQSGSSSQIIAVDTLNYNYGSGAAASGQTYGCYPDDGQGTISFSVPLPHQTPGSHNN